MSGYQAFELADSPENGDSSSKIPTTEEQVDLKRPPVFVLVGGFLAAFSLAWLVAVAVFFSFTKSPVVSELANTSEPSTGPFSSTVKITSTGPVLKVKHTEVLNPAGDDFMLFVWFKSDTVISSEDRSTIISKLGTQEGLPDGYGVALQGGAEGVRPQVYWRNKGTRGRWYVFASTSVQPHQWYLLAVTFRSQRYLGVHIAPWSPNATPEVLGGYDLEGTVIPTSDSDLVVGAIGTSAFRGEIGSFGVIRNVDIVQDVPKIMKKMAREPSLGADVVDSSHVALWANPFVDRGPLKLPVIDLLRRSRRDSTVQR